MSIEPELPPSPSLPDAAPEESWAQPALPAQPPPLRLPRRQRRIPNLGDTLLFLILAAASLFATEIAAFLLVMGMHLFGRESAQQLLRDPRLLIPSMAISYLIAGALAWGIFTNLWRQRFPNAIRWNGSIVRRRLYLFFGVGALLSIAVQLLSNYLPIPKALPIDNFFRTPTDIWLVAIFGTFLAPVLEELAFRGFLFPSLASAWDRMTGWTAQTGAGPASGVDPSSQEAPGTPGSEASAEREPTRDPHWSTAALVFSMVITSIGFALLHADQLAHSWAPLLVLFAVSVILCVVRLRAHSLAASTLVHATYNGVIFVLIFFTTDGFRHLDKINR